MLKTVFLDKFDPGSPGSYLAEAIYAAERLFGVTITIHEYDPSSIDSSFVSRRSHIKRRKREP